MTQIVTSVEVVRVPELPELLAKPESSYLIIYNPSDGKTYKILESLLSGGQSTVPNWTPAATFDAGELCIFNLKIWSSKIDGNTGITPIEGASWEEVSKSLAGYTPVWSAGVFDVDRSEVMRYDAESDRYSLYMLRAAAPFTSVDFDAEFANGDWQLVGGGELSAFNKVQMTPQGTPPTPQEGLFYYDDVKKCLVLFDDITGTSVELSYEIPIRCLNNTGATILNGKACYITGAVGGVPTIALAECDSYEKSRVIVVATHDILNGDQGKAVRMGIIHDIPTAEPLAVGDTAYLKFGESGGISKTPPIGGCYKVRLGTIIKTGGGFVDLEVNVSASEYTVETVSERGFPDKSILTLSWDNATRTLTATPTGSTYRFYQNGELRNITTVKTFQITDVEGHHFLYFNGTDLGDLVNGSEADVSNLIRNYVPVAYIYWDATAKTEIFKGVELHYSKGYGVENHIKDHLTEGARYASGLGLIDIVLGGDGSLATHAKFGVNSGVIYDEDLRHAVPNVLSANGVNRIYYRNSSLQPRFVTNAGFSVATTGTGRLAYSPVGGGLVECGDNTFVWYHVFAAGTLTAADGVCTFMGTTTFASAAAAYTGLNADAIAVQSIGLPSPELKLIASVLYQTRDLYTNAVNARIIQSDANGAAFYDWRKERLTGGAGSSGGSGTVAPSFSDADFEVYDNIDTTKKVKVQVSGVPTGQVVELTVPAVSGEIALAPTYLGNAGKLAKVNSAENAIDVTSYTHDQVVQTSAIDYSQSSWMVGESRLLLTTKQSSTEGSFDGAAELMDLILPPGVLSTLESSDANWTNETKTVTGDNSTYALGRVGQFGWLSDRTFVQCTSATYAVSGSATFNRNRAVDALVLSDTQDLAVINLLEPSRTGGTDDDGWNLTTNTKVITTVPCKLGTYWIGGTSGEGYYFSCFAQSGTSFYWKRLGQGATVQRPITTVSHPTLTGRLLAKADWGTSLYTVQAGDETSYQDQTFWDTATRAYFIKVTTTQWEKIK